MSAVSLSFFKVLGFLHGTSTGKPSGRSMPLQKVAIKSLCILPGWTPCAPHLAMNTNSSCWAPSSSAHSASHLMVSWSFQALSHVPRGLRGLWPGCFEDLSQGLHLAFPFLFQASSPWAFWPCCCSKNLFQGSPFFFKKAVSFSRNYFFQEERFLFQENSFLRQLSFKNLFQDLDQWNLHTTHLQLPTLPSKPKLLQVDTAYMLPCKLPVQAQPCPRQLQHSCFTAS